MAHYLLNVPGEDQEQAGALLRAKMWGIGRDEKHRAAAVHDWTPAEAETCPGSSPCGVLLEHIVEWDPPVPMSTVLPRIDPDMSNPYVQQNARAGFQTGVVRISQRI